MVTEVSSSRIVNGLSGLLAAAVLSISLLSAVPAGADPLLVVNVRGGQLSFGGYQDNYQTRLDSASDGLLPGQELQGSVSGAAAGGSYAADSRARASYGALGVSSAAHMSNVAQPNPPDSLESRVRQVFATTQSTWNDTLTIVRPGALAGSLVDVRVTLEVDIASLSASPSTPYAGDILAAYGTLVFQTTGNQNGWCLATGFVYNNPDPCFGAALLNVGQNLITYDTQMIVGDNTWGALLQSETQVYTENTLLANSGSGAVDAFNTAHTYFTVLTDGASLRSASGHDYSVASQPVPEPGTLALVGLGFAGLAASRRRKQ